MDGETQQRAKQRGEGIRAELLTLLDVGPQTPADLLPQLEMQAVSLSEVTFQLERLAEEGQTARNSDGRYQLSHPSPRWPS